MQKYCYCEVVSPCVLWQIVWHSLTSAARPTMEQRTDCLQSSWVCACICVHVHVCILCTWVWHWFTSIQVKCSFRNYSTQSHVPSTENPFIKVPILHHSSQSNQFHDKSQKWLPECSWNIRLKIYFITSESSTKPQLSVCKYRHCPHERSQSHKHTSTYINTYCRHHSGTCQVVLNSINVCKALHVAYNS